MLVTINNVNTSFRMTMIFCIPAKRQQTLYIKTELANNLAHKRQAPDHQNKPGYPGHVYTHRSGQILLSALLAPALGWEMCSWVTLMLYSPQSPRERQCRCVISFIPKEALRGHRHFCGPGEFVGHKGAGWRCVIPSL